jgi:hypothetical protein
MGTKIEQVREQWGHVLVVRDAIAEHDAEIAALTARAERAEAALANLRRTLRRVG